MNAAVERGLAGVGVVRRDRRDRRGPDLVAGAVLAAILVPQGIACAELADLPAAIGLHTTVACLSATRSSAPTEGFEQEAPSDDR